MAKRLHLTVRQSELRHHSSDLVWNVADEPVKPNEKEVAASVGREQRKQAIAYQVVKSRAPEDVTGECFRQRFSPSRKIDQFPGCPRRRCRGIYRQRTSKQSRHFFRPVGTALDPAFILEKPVQRVVRRPDTMQLPLQLMRGKERVDVDALSPALDLVSRCHT